MTAKAAEATSRTRNQPYGIRRVCEVWGVPRSSFYAAQARNHRRGSPRCHHAGPGHVTPPNGQKAGRPGVASSRPSTRSAMPSATSPPAQRRVARRGERLPQHARRSCCAPRHHRLVRRRVQPRVHRAGCVTSPAAGTMRGAGHRWVRPAWSRQPRLAGRSRTNGGNQRQSSVSRRGTVSQTDAPLSFSA